MRSKSKNRHERCIYLVIVIIDEVYLIRRYLVESGNVSVALADRALMLSSQSAIIQRM